MKMIDKLISIFFLSLPLLFASCDLINEKHDVKIPYPEPLPDSVALNFLPGIVSSDSIDFGSAFSPDGKSFYFSRTTNHRSKIYSSHYNGENWTEPLLVPFADTAYAEADPAFSPDGKLYFISTRPKNESDILPDYDIWVVSPLNGDTWSQPVNAESINSDSAEYYISFSAIGNLYFASSRAGGLGEEDLYFSKLIEGKYTPPENLGTSVNSVFSEYDPCISPTEDFIIFTSSNRKDGFGKGDLYYSTINNRMTWSEGHNLGRKFNSPAREYCPYLTPDGKYFFFSSDGNIKWIDSRYLNTKVDVK